MKIIYTLAGVALIAGVGVTVPALATGGGSEPEVPCDVPTVIVTDKPAYDEQVLVSPEVPAIAEVWANFSPNKKKGTFVGPPYYPHDERGTWNLHNKIPGGHVGPDGVYPKGNPAKGGNWFYRQAGQDYVPAVYKTVHHEAETPTDTETNTDPTVVPLPSGYSVLDPCGPSNAEWLVTAIDDHITWEVSEGTGHLVASINIENVVFPDGTTSHDFGLPTETNTEPCDTPTDEPEIDEPVVNEPEGPVTTETNCTATRCVKTTYNDKGEPVGEPEVVDYGNVKEEGL